MGLLSISVDLDEISCYHEIHGLGTPAKEVAGAIYRRVLPRIARFFGEVGIPATFFVVGRDLLLSAESGQQLCDLLNRGHEIGNHTMNHRYDFALCSDKDQQMEIDQAAEIIGREIGVRPVGFRAPGYNIHVGVIELLRARQYSYDSSVFPCPLYYSLKFAAIGAKALQRTPSASTMGDPRILRAPTTPYRVGDNGVWERGDGLCELPITVLTRTRIPFIGTSLSVMGKWPASLLARVAARLPFVNLELHGIDFADADGDGFGYLKKYQPDLRVSLVKRRAILERVVDVLLKAGLEAVTLSDAAKRVFV